jgi:MYXO-CTERM domain-containing protein
MTSPLALAVTALLAAGAGQVPAYERSTAGEGLCQYWPDPASPAVRGVAYEVSDPGATPACRSGGDPIEAIRSAFDAWSAASTADASAPCTDMQLFFQGVTTDTATGADGKNRIAIRRGPCSGSHSVVPPDAPCIAAGTCADDLGCWDHDRLIALTTITYRVSTGAILDADVEVNAGDGGDDDEGFLVTCLDPPAPVCSEERRTGCIGMDLRNTVTHEVGHFLGLSHSNLRASTMFAKAAQGETRKRVLSADAVEGMCDIYPLGGPVKTCGSAAEGCSTVGAKDTWLGLAALALLLRRRPRQHTTTPA